MKMKHPLLLSPWMSYVLTISSLVVGCLLSGTHCLMGEKAPVYFLILWPCLISSTYLLVWVYRVVDQWRMAVEGFLVCVAVGLVVWIVGCIPLASSSVVQASAWQEVMGRVPRLALWLGVCYGIAVFAMGCFDFRNIGGHTGPAWQVTMATLWGMLVMGMILQYGLADVSLGQGPHTLSWVVMGCLFFLLGMLKYFGKVGLATWFGLGSFPDDTAKWLGNHKVHHLANPVYRRCLAFFVLVLLTTNVVSIRYFTLGSYLLTAGILTYPFTFVLTDLVGELYGSTRAREVVWTGFMASLFMMGTVVLVCALPIYTNFLVSRQQAFLQVFAFTPGMVLASMGAYLIAQLTDVYLFDVLRSYTQGKHLWLRNNVATMISQLLDTLVFSLIVWIIWPLLDPTRTSCALTWDVWYQLTVNECKAKWVMALLDTPVVYGVLKVIKKNAID